MRSGIMWTTDHLRDLHWPREVSLERNGDTVDLECCGSLSIISAPVHVPGSFFCVPENCKNI